MQNDTQMGDVRHGLRRAQSGMGASTALLWIRDDILLFGVIVVVAILSFIFLPWRDPVSNKPSVDRAMAAMVGGTGGGVCGALFGLLVNAMWQHTIPTHSMEIMTASMAGMIGGTLGGGWQFFLCKLGQLRIGMMAAVPEWTRLAGLGESRVINSPPLARTKAYGEES